MSRRTFFAAFLLVALVLAGFVSYYASAHPDGLTHVAEQTGLVEQQRPSATAGSPMAGYETKGVHNTRLSGGLAGVLGCLAVLGITSGLALVVRRRGAAGSTTEPTSGS